MNKIFKSITTTFSLLCATVLMLVGLTSCRGGSDKKKNPTGNTTFPSDNPSDPSGSGSSPIIINPTESTGELKDVYVYEAILLSTDDDLKPTHYEFDISTNITEDNFKSKVQEKLNEIIEKTGMELDYFNKWYNIDEYEIKTGIIETNDKRIHQNYCYIKTSSNTKIVIMVDGEESKTIYTKRSEGYDLNEILNAYIKAGKPTYNVYVKNLYSLEEDENFEGFEMNPDYVYIEDESVPVVGQNQIITYVKIDFEEAPEGSVKEDFDELFPALENTQRTAYNVTYYLNYTKKIDFEKDIVIADNYYTYNVEDDSISYDVIIPLSNANSLNEAYYMDGDEKVSLFLYNGGIEPDSDYENLVRISNPNNILADKTIYLSYMLYEDEVLHYATKDINANDYLPKYEYVTVNIRTTDLTEKYDYDFKTEHTVNVTFGVDIEIQGGNGKFTNANVTFYNAEFLEERELTVAGPDGEETKTFMIFEGEAPRPTFELSPIADVNYAYNFYPNIVLVDNENNIYDDYETAYCYNRTTEFDENCISYPVSYFRFDNIRSNLLPSDIKGDTKAELQFYYLNDVIDLKDKVLTNEAIDGILDLSIVSNPAITILKTDVNLKTTALNSYIYFNNDREIERIQSVAYATGNYIYIITSYLPYTSENVAIPKYGQGEYNALYTTVSLAYDELNVYNASLYSISKRNEIINGYTNVNWYANQDDGDYIYLNVDYGTDENGNSYADKYALENFDLKIVYVTPTGEVIRKTLDGLNCHAYSTKNLLSVEEVNDEQFWNDMEENGFDAFEAHAGMINWGGTNTRIKLSYATKTELIKFLNDNISEEEMNTLPNKGYLYLSFDPATTKVKNLETNEVVWLASLSDVVYSTTGGYIYLNVRGFYDSPLYKNYSEEI